MYEKEECSKNTNHHKSIGVCMISVGRQENNNVWFSAAVQDDQVLVTYFSPEDPDLKRILLRLPEDTMFEVLEEPNQFLAKVLKAIEEVFNGNDRETFLFNIGLQHLSSYTQNVLQCTSLVPVGYVTTYGAIAKVSGGIARSVGRVEASNPVPLLIPCHRVVSSDLRIGGYGYGEQTKWEILQREDRGYEESKKLKIDDTELILFPIKWIKKNHG